MRSRPDLSIPDTRPLFPSETWKPSASPRSRRHCSSVHRDRRSRRGHVTRSLFEVEESSTKHAFEFFLLLFSFWIYARRKESLIIIRNIGRRSFVFITLRVPLPGGIVSSQETRDVFRGGISIGILDKKGNDIRFFFSKHRELVGSILAKHARFEITSREWNTASFPRQWKVGFRGFEAVDGGRNARANWQTWAATWEGCGRSDL